MVSDIPYTLAPIAFSFGLYWTAGLLPDWPTFWAFTGVLTLMSQAAMSLGVALACFSLDPAIGLTLLPLAAAPMILFSGVLYDQASIPRSLAWLSSFSIVNHGFELLLALQAPALPEGQAAPALAFVGVDPDPKSLRGHVAALGAILAGECVPRASSALGLRLWALHCRVCVWYLGRMALTSLRCCMARFPWLADPNPPSTPYIYTYTTHSLLRGDLFGPEGPLALLPARLLIFVATRAAAAAAAILLFCSYIAVSARV